VTAGNREEMRQIDIHCCNRVTTAR
jgi:hypothetical protein